MSDEPASESESDPDSDLDAGPDRPTTTGAADAVVSFDESADPEGESSRSGFTPQSDLTENEEAGTPDADRSESTDGRQNDRRDGPLGELADAVGTRGARSPRSDSPSDSETHDGADAATLFEREDVQGIDRDALWQQLQRGDTDESDADEAPLADREIREIQKRDYCHGCEYFEQPPTVGCTHPGTDVLEFPTLETVRVADCPVVLEDEALEERR